MARGPLPLPLRLIDMKVASSQHQRPLFSIRIRSRGFD